MYSSYLAEFSLFFLVLPSDLACLCLVWKNLPVPLPLKALQPSVNTFHSVPKKMTSFILAILQV